MQRRATKQSRGANSDERKFMAWIKERGICAACGNRGHVVCHHLYGSAAKIKVDLITVLIGHSAVIGLCQCCDNIVTRGSRRKFVDEFGPQNALWALQYKDSPVKFPPAVVQGIMDYERRI